MGLGHCTGFEQRLIGHEHLEPINFDLQFTHPKCIVGFGGLLSTTPIEVRVLADAQLATDIADPQSLGQVAIWIPETNAGFAPRCDASP